MESRSSSSAQQCSPEEPSAPLVLLKRNHTNHGIDILSQFNHVERLTLQVSQVSSDIYEYLFYDRARWVQDHMVSCGAAGCELA